MSQQIVYQLFHVSGYKLTELETENHCATLHVEPHSHRVCCPECKSKNVILRGYKVRLFHNLPIGSNCTFVKARIPRVECRECNLVRQITVGFADARRSYTHAFERYVLELSGLMTMQDIARHLLVSWDIVKDIQKRHLQKHYAKPPLKHVKQIAIDEICIGSGHRYLTLVMDLKTGAILFVGKGKKAESLAPFWRRVRAARANIDAVAMDMSPAFLAAVEAHLPNAVIVHDHFHIVKMMNDKLSQLRRDLFHDATKRQQKVLKGSRWLLLMNPENLDPVKGEPKRLREALRLNESLAVAYYLKEDLRQLWKQPNKEAARLKLIDWYHQAMASGVRILQEMARTLLANQWRILAYYDYPISTGPLEGLNNKIKTMQRQHYGLRDQEFLILKLHQLHEAKYALVG